MALNPRLNMEPIAEKRWNKELESEIFNSWKDSQVYKFDKNSPAKVYSIDTPPPYVNTPIHIGHATTYCLMDMFARYKRMSGFNVLFPLGLDKNGLPIEMAAEKKFKIKMLQTPRDEFIKKCKIMLEEAGGASENSFLRLGIGFNSWTKGNEVGQIYETDSDDYRALTQQTFIEMWKKGLIYEDERINNFCPGCQTTLADAEVDYEDKQSYFNDIKFKVKETNEEIVIGTTRPELISTCGMVIFHPDDDRYKHLDGKTAITPIYEREVPIKAHPQASIDKGTGLVMMCSAGDLADIRFFREMNLDPKIAIETNGTMNEIAGPLQGLRVKEARKKIIELIKEKSLLVDQKQTIHRTPICERSKDEIEFIAMKEFYVKQIDYKEDMLKIAKELNFYSESSKQILIDWINSISIDWPISRRRYYATEVPLWYCNKCNEVYLPKPGKYYKPWQDKPEEKCKCGSDDFRGEERVFDTWFDSSISPLYILKYNNKEFYEKNTPCSLRPQGKEIIRTWLYYTLLKDYHLTGKRIFDDVWINYHIIDDKGYKMSKSKGNVIDPQKILDLYGAEPFRLWAAVEGNLDKSDFRCSFDRIEGAGKSIVKLWNVARFISMFEEKGKAEPTELDKWIINEVEKLVEVANKGYDNYDFHNPAIEIRHFIWETFASHYLEMAKNRAYNQEGKFTEQEQAAAVQTLRYVLNTVLKLLSPIVPMITYKIYNHFNGKDIHFEEFPKPKQAHELEFTTEQLEELNKSVWKAKKDASKSLKEAIAVLEIPEHFKSIEKDLVNTHNIEKISFSREVKITV